MGPLCLGIFVDIYWMLIGSICTGIIAFFLNTYYTGKKLHYSSWMQIKDIAPNYGLGFIIALSVYFIKYLPISNFIILPIQFIVGAGVFFLICEKTKKEEGWEDEEDDYKCENEKEIKDNCEIKINNETIPFSYDYKFNKVGKYIIKYSFKNNITKTSCLFYGCSSLTYVDLSNFKAQNVTNMVSMFRDCSNLKKINLSNFTSQNVSDIGAMFYGCKSLTEIINLSDFNTINISNMANLFYKCSCLTDINLTNFNILKVSDMTNMFFECTSLTKIYLSNLNLKLLLTWIECSLDIEL